MPKSNFCTEYTTHKGVKYFEFFILTMNLMKSSIEKTFGSASYFSTKPVGAHLKRRLKRLVVLLINSEMKIIK